MMASSMHRRASALGRRYGRAKAKKLTYRVEFRGQVFTRTTARIYTHLVVGRLNLSRDIEREKNYRSTHLENHAYHCREADPQTRKHDEGSEKLAEHTRIAKLTPAVYADRMVSEDLARIEENRKAGHYDEYRALGWASRLDLARKNADSQSRFVDIHILEVPPPA